MKEARIYVDFNEMPEDNLVFLSKTNFVTDSKGKSIKLSEGKKIKLYSNDLSSCSEADNLIAEGTVERNSLLWNTEYKWTCRISKAGIYNESQSD